MILRLPGPGRETSWQRCTYLLLCSNIRQPHLGSCSSRSRHQQVLPFSYLDQKISVGAPPSPPKSLSFFIFQLQWSSIRFSWATAGGVNFRIASVNLSWVRAQVSLVFISYTPHPHQHPVDSLDSSFQCHSPRSLFVLVYASRSVSSRLPEVCRSLFTPPPLSTFQPLSLPPPALPPQRSSCDRHAGPERSP